MEAASTFSGRQIKVSALVAGAGVIGALCLCQLSSISHEWQIFLVLSAVAVIGFIAGQHAAFPILRAAQPWTIHAIWLVPAVLLTDPSQFLPLLVLSLAVTLWPFSRSAFWSRLPVAVSTVIGCAVLYAVSRISDSWQWGLAVGLPAMLGLAAVMAVLCPRLTGSATRSGFARECHWTAIEVCSASTGCLVTVAMADQPVVGLTAIPPMVLAVFALRWPELTSQARTDDKTGLPNAGRWEDVSRHALATNALTGAPVSLLILDIDHFKAVNDTYGHLAGDGILADVAECIRAEIGCGDLVGRFGGEEFVVTTVRRSEAESLALAERIRARIAATEHDVTTRDGEVLVAAPVTCTIGVASSETLGYDHTTLLRRADAALATGKCEGRNQVVRATEVGRPTSIPARPTHPGRPARRPPSDTAGTPGTAGTPSRSEPRTTGLHPVPGRPLNRTPLNRTGRPLNRTGLTSRPPTLTGPAASRAAEPGMVPTQRSRAIAKPVTRPHDTDS